jgi:hypothetical protein
LRESVSRAAITATLCVSAGVLAGDLVGQATMRAAGHVAGHVAVDAGIATGITEAVVSTTCEGRPQKQAIVTGSHGRRQYGDAIRLGRLVVLILDEQHQEAIMNVGKGV